MVHRTYGKGQVRNVPLQDRLERRKLLMSSAADIIREELDPPETCANCGEEISRYSSFGHVCKGPRWMRNMST